MWVHKAAPEQAFFHANIGTGGAGSCCAGLAQQELDLLRQRGCFITNPSFSRAPLSPFNMRVRCLSTFSQVIYVKEPRAGTQTSLAAQAEAEGSRLNQGCASRASSCKLPCSHRPCSHVNPCSTRKVTAER